MLSHFIAAIVLGLAASVARGGGTLKVGMILDFDSFSGQGIRQAALLAASDGEQLVKIYSYNAQCNATKGRDAMKWMIKKGVMAVLGGQCSGTTLEAVPVANKNKILLISPAASSPTLTTEGGEYFYRTMPSDSRQGGALAEQVQKDEVSKLLVLTDDGPYGMGISDAIVEALEGSGISTQKMVLTKDDMEKDIDLSFNPDGVCFFGNDDLLLGTAMRNIVQNQSYSGKKYGGDVQYNPPFKNVASDDGMDYSVTDGMIVTTPYRGTEPFIASFRKYYSDTNYPPPYASLGYDAMKTIIRAYKDATYGGKHATPEAIAKEVQDTKFLGAYGLIEFDENHDPVTAKYNLFRSVGASWSWV